MATEKREVKAWWEREALAHIMVVRNAKLAVAFVVLNVVDAAVTQAAIGNGGFEFNSLMRVLLKQPAWVFWWFKISLALVIALTLLLLVNKFPRQIHRIFIGLVIAMAGVCVLNGVGL